MLGRSPEPRCGSPVVLPHIASVLVPFPELRLRCSVSRDGQLAQRRDREFRDRRRRRIRSRRVDRRRLGGSCRRHRDRRALRQRPRQVVLAHQRVVLVRTLRAVGRRQDLRAHPTEQQPDLERRLQVRQQRRRIGAVPAPTVRRRRSGCRRIRHQRLVPQQFLVELPEAASAHAPARHRPLHRPRQRIVPAGIENHQPQRRSYRRRHQVLQRRRLVAHVDVALQARVDWHDVVHAVHLQAVSRVEDQRHVRPRAAPRERAQRLVQFRQPGVEGRRHLEAETAERRRDGGRVVRRVRQSADVGVRAVADDKGYPSVGQHDRGRREQNDRQQQDGAELRGPHLFRPHSPPEGPPSAHNPHGL